MLCHATKIPPGNVYRRQGLAQAQRVLLLDPFVDPSIERLRDW